MDYSKFLGKKEEAVLAYLGGPHAYGKDRRLRVDAPRPSIGFHRFEIKGRTARALEVVECPDLGELGDLPRLRGHHVRGWITRDGLRDQRERVHGLERVQLMPAEEPAPLSIVRARRWHSGDLVFESLDFDGEVEEEARLRLEKLEPLGEIKHTPSSLRLAYGVALAMIVAERMRIPLSIREAVAGSTRITEGGEAAARIFITAVESRRVEESDRARIRAIVEGRRPREPVQATPVRHRDNPTLDNAHIRAEIALDGAHARMLSSRNLGDGNLEVAFEFMGERFISVVDAITLHVYDSGVCLAGADELVTLDSLPGVIREAIEDDVLVITRH
jgi:hypothetical protein